LTCIDPNPLVPADLWARLSSRASMLVGCSPERLPDAVTLSGGRFDFVFIDGDHTRIGVSRDIEGVLGIVEPGAYLVFHDSHHPEIRSAIEDALERHGVELLDVGLLSKASTAALDGGPGAPEQWGGLRMLRTRETAR
jgi:hypothetical protein